MEDSRKANGMLKYRLSYYYYYYYYYYYSLICNLYYQTNIELQTACLPTKKSLGKCFSKGYDCFLADPTLFIIQSSFFPFRSSYK
jgi:hypothetical protein